MKRPVLIMATAVFLITHAANLQTPLYGTYAEMAFLEDAQYQQLTIDGESI